MMQIAKRMMMQLTRLSLVRVLMRLAVRLIVPKRRIGAAIAIFNDEGKVLLLKHAFHGRHPWALPGGWVNRREEPADAVIRELREETGLSAELDRPIHVTISPKLNNIDIFYRGYHPQGTLSTSFEIVEGAWFDPQQLPNGILDKTRDAIRAATGENG